MRAENETWTEATKVKREKLYAELTTLASEVQSFAADQLEELYAVPRLHQKAKRRIGGRTTE
jgi:hypothetical protein